MKIHYLVTSLEGGGAEFAIPSIVQSLEHEGHDVSVTACEPRDMGAAHLLDRNNIPYTVLFEKRPSIFKSVYSFIKLLKKSKPDIIWTSLGRATTIGQIAGLLMNIPVVSWKHSASERLPMKLGKHLTALWVADSFFVAQFLSETMHIPHDKIVSWPLYICHPHANERRLWDGQDILHIGSTGRLHPVKNYPYLLKGLALFCSRHPEWSQRVHLSLAGDGPQKQEIEHIIHHYGLEKNVSLLGFVSDIDSFLRTLHVYTQPSHYEGMCLAAHEAMAMGLPIIATPVGELSRSVQEGKTGFILGRDEEIVESFCEKIEYIFSNSTSLQEMGKNSQEYVFSNFSKKKHKDRCKKIVAKIITLIDPI